MFELPVYVCGDRWMIVDSIRFPARLYCSIATVSDPSRMTYDVVASAGGLPTVALFEAQPTVSSEIAVAKRLCRMLPVLLIECEITLREAESRRS
jgi:hypothetical protein